MSNDFDDTFLSIYAYIIANYYYYSGVMMRLVIDWNKFSTAMEMVRYAIVSVILVSVSKKALEMSGLNEFSVFCIIFCVSVMGQQVLRYAIDDALIDIMKAVKAKILKHLE